MVNPQLLQYVRTQRAAGVSKEDIIKALAGGGWSAADALEAFTTIEAPPPPPPMTPKPPPVQPMASAAMSPAMQPRSAPTPVIPAPQPMMSVRPQPAAVVQQRPVYTPQRKRSRWPWILLGLIFFFIIGAGAGAYAAVTYEWFYDAVAGLVGVTPVEQSSMEQVTPQGTGGFLEVSPEPFGTSSAGE
ncbi:MAG: hypothetical protein Q8P58_02900 [Candidatus Adlerbacteria bacterium]|nr:hypothetical protein [Candidatus Adlerbacteria bacterium]MDZ4226129.1 hypothetical protein [Patescibacteria group bacterium]